MKLNSKNAIENVIYGDVDHVNFYVADDSKILEFLSSKVYSDKILAPIRELICNAHDSHVAAGTKKKFDVHLPCEAEPFFYIRDYGVGLSHDEINKLYAGYGATTKDDTNAAIGCLGIGSKAPFAYAKEFSVISYQNGIKNIYLCSQTPNKMGCDRFKSDKTHEPNGLEVRFDVKPHDLYDFQVKTRKMYFFQDEINFVGPVRVDFPNIPDYKAGSTSSNTNRWFIEMGGVIYDVDMNFTRNKDISTIYRSWDNGYIFHAELGDVDITLSRESVELTNKTIRFLEVAAKRVIDNIKSEFRKDYLKVETTQDKIITYLTYRKNYTFFRNSKLDSWIENLKEKIRYENNISCFKARYTRTRNDKYDVMASLGSTLFYSEKEKRVWVEYPENKTHAITKAMKNYAEKENVAVYLVNNKKMSDFLKKHNEKVVRPDYFDNYKPEKNTNNVASSKAASTNVACMRKHVPGYAPITISKQDFESWIKSPNYKVYFWVTDNYRVKSTDVIKVKVKGNEYAVNVANVADYLNRNAYTFSKSSAVVIKISSSSYAKLKKSSNSYNITEEIEKSFKNTKGIERYKHYRLVEAVATDIRKVTRFVTIDSLFLKKYKGGYKNVISECKSTFSWSSVIDDKVLSFFDFSVYVNCTDLYPNIHADRTKITSDLNEYIDTTFPMLSLILRRSSIYQSEPYVTELDIIKNYIKECSNKR